MTEQLDSIQAAIPHREPMLLVDEVVEQNDQSILCRKTFSDNDFFVHGHFPGYPLVPGVILCECALQSGAILLSKLAPHSSSALPVATRMDNVKFKQMVRPGDTIEISVVLNETVSTAFFMTGKITVGGKLSVRLDFACYLVEPQ